MYYVYDIQKAQYWNGLKFTGNVTAETLAPQVFMSKRDAENKKRALSVKFTEREELGIIRTVPVNKEKPGKTYYINGSRYNQEVVRYD